VFLQHYPKPPKASLRLLTLTMFDQASLPSRIILRSLFRSAVFAVSD
jgi:hypothetical protein